MRFRVPNLDKHSAVHHAHTVAHICYLSAAAFHGGIYGYAAITLIVVIVFGLFIGETL